MLTRTLGVVCLLVAVPVLVTVSTQAQERRGREREEERREFERRDERPWRFERGFGWRFEHRPGVWSPYYAWSWPEGHVMLLPSPTLRVIQYPPAPHQLPG